MYMLVLMSRILRFEGVQLAPKHEDLCIPALPTVHLGHILPCEKHAI